MRRKDETALTPPLLSPHQQQAHGCFVDIIKFHVISEKLERLPSCFNVDVFEVAERKKTFDCFCVNCNPNITKVS